MSSQNIFDLRINVRQIEDIIKFGFRRKRSIFLYGGAGVGKSQKIAQIADMLFPTNTGRNLVDVRLSDKEPQDVTGIPVPVTMPDGKVVTVYATPSFWPDDPNWVGIVFLDELTNAPAACQQAAYQIILDGKIGEYTFPVGALRVGAGNREGDGGATNTLLSPLANRMCLVEVDYDLDIWIEDFAVPNDVHPSIIGFLKQSPDMFYTGDKDDLEPGTSFATPRSWVGGSDALYDYDLGLMSQFMTHVAVQGMVGNGMDSLVLDYHTRTRKLPKVEGVLDGSIQKHHLENHEVDLLYVLSQTCLSQLRKDALSQMDDQQVLDRVHNFLTFMHDNYGKTNMDIIVAMTVNIFRGTGTTKSILTQNDKREKMIPRLLRHSNKVGEIVKNYTKQYGDLMAEIDGTA